MKGITIFGFVVYCLCAASAAYSQQDVNYYCVDECRNKNKPVAYCRSLCATTGASGQQTKDRECLSSCLDKGKTNYHCYSACQLEQPKTTIIIE